MVVLSLFLSIRYSYAIILNFITFSSSSVEERRCQCTFVYCNILIKRGWCLLGGFHAGNIDDADMPMKRLKVSKVAYLYDEGSGGDGLG